MARRLERLSRAKGWCFTLNNYNDDDIKRIDGIECKYIIYGKEKGLLGTPHLQGYVFFRSVVSFVVVCGRLGERCHIEKAKGSPPRIVLIVLRKATLLSAAMSLLKALALI